MHSVDPEEFSAYLRAGSQTIDLFRKLRDMWPGKNAEKTQIEAKIDEAEKAFKASEVQLAKTLGYHLCQCTFPPEIMLSKGRHPKHDMEIFECAKCHKQIPSVAHFKSLDNLVEQQTANAKAWKDQRI